MRLSALLWKNACSDVEGNMPSILFAAAIAAVVTMIALLPMTTANPGAWLTYAIGSGAFTALAIITAGEEEDYKTAVRWGLSVVIRTWVYSLAGWFVAFAVTDGLSHATSIRAFGVSVLLLFAAVFGALGAYVFHRIR